MNSPWKWWSCCSGQLHGPRWFLNPTSQCGCMYLPPSPTDTTLQPESHAFDRVSFSGSPDEDVYERAARNDGRRVWRRPGIWTGRDSQERLVDLRPRPAVPSRSTTSPTPISPRQEEVRSRSLRLDPSHNIRPASFASDTATVGSRAAEADTEPHHTQRRDSGNTGLTWNHRSPGVGLNLRNWFGRNRNRRGGRRYPPRSSRHRDHYSSTSSESENDGDHPLGIAYPCAPPPDFVERGISWPPTWAYR